MRTLLTLTLVGLVASDSSWEKQGDCMVDGGEAVNDAADAALFIWAAMKRCDKPKLEIKCAVDVTSVIESVNGMVNVMLRAIDKCGHLQKKNKDCGLAAGRFTKNFAGLAAASADIVQKCPNPLANQHEAAAQFKHALALCVVDMKDSAKSLFKMVREFMEVGHNCKKEENRHCIANAFRIIGAFSAVGEFVAGSIGHCSKVPRSQESALCAQASSSLIHHTADLAAAATDLSRKCVHKKKAPVFEEPDTVVVETQVSRLFEQGGQAATTASSTNLLLGAFLPVTAIVGFVGGRYYANNRMRAEQMREVMSDNDVE